MRRILGVLVLTALTVLASPLATRAEDPPADEPFRRRERARPERPFLREAEFAEDPALVALPHQVVILDLEAADGPRQNVHSYRLAAGSYRFCVGEHVTRVTVESLPTRAQRRTGPLLDVDRQTPCAARDLPEGRYRITTWHDGSAMPAGGRVGFASAGTPYVSAIGRCLSSALEDCIAKEGYFPLIWVTNGQLLRATPVPDWQCVSLPHGSLALQLQADGNLHVDEYALIRFHPGDGDPNRGPRLLAQDLPLGLGHRACLDDPYKGIETRPMWAGPTPTGDVNLLDDWDRDRIFFYDSESTLRPSYDVIVELYGTSFDPTHRYGGFKPYAYGAGPRGGMILRRSWWEDRHENNFYMPFRYLPDGGKLDVLATGEVALFQGCDYTGKATVFPADMRDLATYSSPTITLDKSAASVKLGHNTAVTLYSGAGFTGEQVTLRGDTPCLDALDFKGKASSLRIQFLVNVLIDTKACVGCDFTGVDLSRVDLTGVDLRGANLTRARLHGAHLDNANLEGANMSGVFLTANPNGNVLAAASLTGANLKNVNLTGAQLSGANFTSANFYGTQATAEGARATDTEFGGAYLAGANFAGATFTGVRFSEAVLVGANFQGATLASASGGSDSGFLHAHLQGANFAGAIITGVSFRGAYVDFQPNGNSIIFSLGPEHTTFAGSKNPDQHACVAASYTAGSVLPETNSTITCPDGTPASSHTPPGCGPSTPENTRWKAQAPLFEDQDEPPASYFGGDATYSNQADTPVCFPPQKGGLGG